MNKLPHIVAMSLFALASVAFAHVDDDHGKGRGTAHEGHASALGKPGDPKK